MTFKIAFPRVGFDLLGDAVGAENNDGAFGNFIGFLDEYDAFVLQPLHHMRVMNDFMAHINRRAEFIERHFDDFDGAFNSGAKTAGLGQNDLHAC